MYSSGISPPSPTKIPWTTPMSRSPMISVGPECWWSLMVLLEDRGRGRARSGLPALGHWKDAAGRSRHHVAGLEILQSPGQMQVFPDVLRRPPPAEQGALDGRGLEVAHRQLAGDVDPTGVVQRRSRQDLVEVPGHDAAMGRPGRTLEARGDDDRSEHPAIGAEAADA